MDVSKRVIQNNAIAATVFALYFSLQMYDSMLRTVSFLVTVPVAKIAVDRLIVFVEVKDTTCYPPKELIRDLIRNFWGVWSVIVMELVRRIVSFGWGKACLSIALMLLPMVGYIFSVSTGVCFTNTEDYERGTIGFAIAVWVEFTISILLGSGWVLQ